MNEDKIIEAQRERLEDEAEEECVRVEDRVWALMQPGQACYPWSALHIQEAFVEASLNELKELQEAAEGSQIAPWMEFGTEGMRIVREYWERQARSLAG